MSFSPLSVMHVNVNCSDLERSLVFYRDRVGLVPKSHTNPMPQEGAGFGLPGRVVWDAHLLHGDRGYGSAALDLLEWKTPRAIGRPAGRANQLGFVRLCLAHPDLDSLHSAFTRAGVAFRSGTVSVPVLEEQAVRLFLCEDQDGSLIGFVERPGPVRMSHININGRDVDASSDGYQRVLGVSPIVGRAESPPANGAAFGLDGDCDYRADFLALGGHPESLILDLLEWKNPKPIGEPFSEANPLGIFRMAFMVDDAAQSCAELDQLGISHSGVCWLETGPEIPIDGLNAVFFRDPDGTCLEWIETPRINES